MQYMQMARRMRNATPPPAAIPAIAPVPSKGFVVEVTGGATGTEVEDVDLGTPVVGVTAGDDCARS
jgi:hypothetical protein